MLNERIRGLRLARGLTLQQVGDAFGISRGSVSSWESGVNQPDPRKLQRLAQLFETTVEFLVTGASSAPQPLTSETAATLPFVPWSKMSDFWRGRFVPNDVVAISLQTAVGPKAFCSRFLGPEGPAWSSSPVPSGALLVIDPETPGTHGRLVVINRPKAPLSIGQILSVKNQLLIHSYQDNEVKPLGERSGQFWVVLEWCLRG
jgi:transcriptional regulator with XRE-family HTH domain